MTTGPQICSDALVLNVRGLSKTFPGTIALSNVDVSVRRGEIHALVGQNGSGKSTFIKVLAGYHRPDQGVEARLNDKPLDLGDPDVVRNGGIRFVHQDLGLVNSLDAIDNLALGRGFLLGKCFRIRWREQRTAARERLHTLGYDFDLSEPVANLRPVERTALAIARSLDENDGSIHLLVLDEPTATMPKPDVERLHALVRRLRDRGTAVLYVSHHLDEVFELADRVTVLRDGVRAGTRDIDGLSRSQLVDLMTGGVVDESSPAPAPSVARPAVFEATQLTGGAIKNLDLTLREGEIVGIAGLAGSGRDDFCGMVFGRRMRRGEVRVHGTRLEPQRPDKSIALGLGFVPADRHADGLVLTMSIRENLSLVDLSAYWKRARLRRGIEQRETARWMKNLGIRSRVDTNVESLSGGNQQKIVLAKWLRLDPVLLLLDEPTQGVDIAAKVDTHRLIANAAARGAAVVVCSSDEAELQQLCHRVIVMRQGKIAAELSGADISVKRITEECLTRRGAEQLRRDV